MDNEPSRVGSGPPALRRLKQQLRRLPRSRRLRRSRIPLAVVLVAALGVSVLTGSRPPQQHGVDPAALLGQPTAALPTSATSPTQTIGLVTGERVQVTKAPGGRAVISPAPAKRDVRSLGDSAVATFQVGGDVFALPSKALPYLGKKLDPSLFDVSYLQRAGYASGKPLPLSIDWNTGEDHSIPGVKAPAKGSRTSGSIAAAGATTFGQALTRDGDVALAKVKKISLGAPPAATGPMAGNAPQIPGAVPLSANSAPAGSTLHTITVNTLNRAGESSYAIIVIQNLDSAARGYSIASTAPGDGPVAVSVPDGPYAVQAFVYDKFEAANLPEDIAFVTTPDITVTGDTSVTLDAREAKPITVSVPHKDAAVESADLNFVRRSADGGQIEGMLYGWGEGVSDILPPLRMYATPTPPARKGSLGFADSWELVPPGTGFGGVAGEYTYNLDFPSENGVPDDLTHHLTAADLATEHTRIGATQRGGALGISTTVAFHPWSTMALGFAPAMFDGFPVPIERRDHFGGSTSTIWANSAFSYPNPSTPYVGQRVFAPNRTYSPGEEVTTTWANGPSVPVPEWQSMGLPAATTQATGTGKLTGSHACPVCRQGDVMGFNVEPSGDADPHHTISEYGEFVGFLDDTSGGPTSSIKFYRDGVLTQLGDMPGQIFPMLPGRASYRIDWTQTTPEALTTLGIRQQSVWDFTSATPTKHDELPSYEACTPDVNQDCSYVPLIFAAYDFGADLRGRVAAPGTQTFTVTGFHETGVTGREVTKASVQVSYDDGATWAPAKVTGLGDGKFRVSAEAPAPSATSGYASVKVTLSDATGDSLQQTLIHAYALTDAGSAPAAAGR